jgi:hypothetical protein
MKFAAVAMAAGLVAGAAFGASGSTVKVTLPEAVSVGNATLASGEYTITESTISGGASLFVFRDAKGDAVSAVAMKTAEPSNEQKTEVVLSNAGGTLRLDKMFIEGSSAGYQFNEVK